MNIQPLNSPVAARQDERPAVSGETSPSASVTGHSKPASEPSADELSAAVKKLNDSMSASAQSLEFSIDQDSKRVVVKLIDQNTKEVVRQIPSAEALQMAKSIDKMQGRLINQTA